MQIVEVVYNVWYNFILFNINNQARMGGGGGWVKIASPHFLGNTKKSHCDFIVKNAFSTEIDQTILGLPPPCLKTTDVPDNSYILLFRF